MVDILTAGGSGTDGKLILLGAEGQPILQVQVTNRSGSLRNGEVTLGGHGRDGVLRVFNSKDLQTASIDASSGGLNLGGRAPNIERGSNGSISLYNRDGRNPIAINAGGDRADVLLGDSGVAGYVQLSNGNNGPGPIIELDGKKNALSFGNPGSSDTSMVEIVGQQGAARFGGEGVNGSLAVRDGAGKTRVSLTANDAAIRAGGQSANGSLALRAEDGKTRVSLTAADATVRVGGNGVNGTVSVLGADGQPLLELLGGPNECAMGLGQRDRPARISLYNGAQQEALRLDAATGDILLANADCAEEFDTVPGAEPGMVMVLTDDGSLAPCEKPYDTRVAGVVSGAGSYRPGLILDRRDTGSDRAPVALMGKVYAFADATEHPIGVGDLLTTSARPGHATRVEDRSLAHGAVLGKALAPLPSGHGLIPILVTLQ